MQIRQHISDWKRTIRTWFRVGGSKKPPGPEKRGGHVRRFSSLVRARGPGGSKWPEIHRRRSRLHAVAEAVKRTVLRFGIGACCFRVTG
jgi:hypothetical protein